MLGLVLPGSELQLRARRWRGWNATARGLGGFGLGEERDQEGDELGAELLKKVEDVGSPFAFVARFALGWGYESGGEVVGGDSEGDGLGLGERHGFGSKSEV
jgi:hypothetical protein